MCTMYTMNTLDCKAKCIQCFLMKKETIITFRLPSKTKAIIESLADKDERTTGWIVRKLITEALEERGLLKSKPKDK